MASHSGIHYWQGEVLGSAARTHINERPQKLQNPAEVKQSAKVIAEELKKPKPNRPVPVTCRSQL
jgi:hypothetical protein